MTQTVDGTRSLKISELKRHGQLSVGKPRPWFWRKEGGELTRHVILDYERVRDGELEIIFDYRDAFRRQRVPIVTTVCNYGGSRPWFRCLCGRRVGVLFDGVSAFVCRQCLGLGYACQQQAPRYRPMLRAQSIRRRLGGDGSLMDPFPERPRYMHRKTYEKLRRKGIAVEKRAISVIGGGLSRNLSRLRFLAANVR
jgi:hypothetical protein